MSRPLAGQRVVVTRAAHQAEGLCAAFEAAGADVARLPLLEIAPPADPEPLEQAARHAGNSDWIAFTSANAVHAFASLVDPWPEVRTAVVGPATAAALRQAGVEPDLEAEQSRAEGLVETLRPHLTPGTRFLVPQADDARPDLVDGLRAAGAAVTAVTAYSKRLPAAAEGIARKLFDDFPIGWVTCTSPRIARHFAGLFGDEWPRRRGEMWALSIGPVTSAELRRLGVQAVTQALRPSDEQLVEAMVEASRQDEGL